MERSIPGRGAVRVGLLLLALPQLAIGVWAIVSPSGWYENFPGAGKPWLPLYGSFDEHLATDVGTTFLALGVILVLAAVWMERRVVLAAAIGYLAYQVPHTIFHLGADDALANGDQIANGIALVGANVLAVAIIVATTRRPGTVPSVPSGAGGFGGDGRAGTEGTVPDSRLGPPPTGLLARFARAYGRREYGEELAPTDAYLHTKGLLLGYGAFEMATLRASRVDERLKLLAECKVAAVVGCEWCMDFGSKLSRDHGIPDRQLQELAIYRSSDAFSDLEKLVIDYAAAMSRTPSEVDDDLVARLREHFDDPQMVELTNVIAIENLRARFNHALGLEAQGFSEGAACVVPELAAAAGVATKVTNGDRQPRSPDAV